MATRAITFNPKNIDGSMYVDSTIQVQSDTLNGSINSVSSLINTLAPNSITYYPSSAYTTFSNLSYGSGYVSLLQFTCGYFVYSIYCSDSISQNQGLLSLLKYDSFGGYNTNNGGTANNAFSARDTAHITNSSDLYYDPANLASFVQPDIPHSIAGVTFTYYFVDGAKHFNGVNLLFPTINTPTWMFLFISNNGSSWSLPFPAIKYTGNGNEIFRWTFPLAFTQAASFFRLVIASASNSSFDFSGAQFIKGTSLGIGNSIYPCNLTGTSLLYNNSPFPIIPLVIITNETDSISNTTMFTFRCPTTFNISSNRMPVFSLTTAPETSMEIDLILNGMSIYRFNFATTTNAWAIIFPYNSDSGLTYNSDFTGSSCGQLSQFNTNSDGSLTFNEGAQINVIVRNYIGFSAKGLKLTIYSS